MCAGTLGKHSVSILNCRPRSFHWRAPERTQEARFWGREVSGYQIQRQPHADVLALGGGRQLPVGIHCALPDMTGAMALLPHIFPTATLAGSQASPHSLISLIYNLTEGSGMQ